jgi:Na+-transporting methylmalonyl-CoA/oxaloacetate decarboxylase gamma subunit
MGSASNVPVVIFVFTFYVFIFYLMGNINENLGQSQYTTSSVDTPTKPADTDFTIFDLLIGIPSFIWNTITILFEGMLFTIVGIPVIFSALIFTPLIIAIWYVGMSYVRGNS